MLMLYCQTISNLFERTERFTTFHQMFDVVAVLTNTIQHDQTWCQRGEMIGLKTMFDRVGSPNVPPFA